MEAHSKYLPWHRERVRMDGEIVDRAVVAHPALERVGEPLCPQYTGDAPLAYGTGELAGGQQPRTQPGGALPGALDGVERLRQFE